ncbi:MAG: RsbRD N-terminal domain-containing protein [Candidatus Zixiibacteriota bacterium]
MLTTLLTQKREAILKNWFDRIANTYPADSSKLLNKNNQFANPVGSTFRNEIAKLFDCLVESADAAGVSKATESINRIRAVQDFSPSQAVAFIFYLKSAIREELRDELTEAERLHELLSLESAIDGMALIAFDTYMACRERMHEIKYSDFKRRSQMFGGGRSRSNN